MAVRIKTTVIPEKTLDTMIVTVPAREWRNATIKTIVFQIMTYILLFVLLYLSVYVFKQLPFLQNFIGFSILGIVFVTVLILLPFDSWSKSFKAKVLKKHGWDGQMPYEVEEEYQRFMHHE